MRARDRCGEIAAKKVNVHRCVAGTTPPVVEVKLALPITYGAVQA